MEWTKEEIEKLYSEAMKKSVVDEDFRKEILADANSALEKLSGKTLPQGMKIKVVESDPNYSATFLLPDMLSEDVDMEDLEKAAGGVSGVAVVSVCGAAVAVGPGNGPCGAQACAAKK